MKKFIKNIMITIIILGSSSECLSREIRKSDYDFEFNIRWSKSMSDYEKGKLASMSETFEEKWYLKIRNSVSARLFNRNTAIDVLPILRKNSFTGLIRIKPADFEKFLDVFIIKRERESIKYQLLDLKFHDYYNQKYSFKVDSANTTLVDITVLP